MDFKTLMSTLFGFSAPTFYSWKKEQRPIINLLDKYFTKEDLVEFLETGKIEKLENIYFIENFYQEQFFQFFQIILHGSEKRDAFMCMVELFSNDIENFKNFETYLIKLNKNSKISDTELINYIKEPPISNELFIYIKSNILNNWTTFKKQLKVSSEEIETDDYWILDFIELMTIINSKNLFNEIFFDVYGIRRIPNPPISPALFTEQSINNSHFYSKTIKHLIDQIKSDTWEDSLYIDIDSEPFEYQNEKFKSWVLINK